jgi:ubiquinol-cytochrome c reductase cytochrome b subunit
MSEIELKKEEETIPFFPDHVFSELKVIGGLTALVLLVGVIGLLSPVGLGDPADPMVTPDHVKPEWYFLALYQILKFVPKTAGVVVPLLGVVLLALWPFLDRKPERSRRVQRMRLIIILIGIGLFIALTIWGEVS